MTKYEAYATCRCKVISIGRKNGYICVTVQINHNELYRYTNLKTVNVLLNDELQKGNLIGSSSAKISMEYCTTWKGSSSSPVRIGNMTYYKQSAQDVLDGSYAPYESYGSQVTTSMPLIKMTQEQLEEFSGNRGDEMYG